MFYQELLTLPFEAPPNSKYEVPDESEVTAQILFSELDLFRLQRVVGKAAAKKMLSVDETRTIFS